MTDFPNFYSADFKEFIKFLLKYDPKDRPAFKQIANKPIL